jgi:phosphoglycolate phosphatase
LRRFACTSALQRTDPAHAFIVLSHRRSSLVSMSIYANRKRLIIFDADGTLVDAFPAIAQTFLHHGMAIGDLERFQKRRKVLKYLGGLREFPTNLRKQFGKQSRKRLLATLTEVYRNDAQLYPGIASLLRTLLADPGIHVGLVTRNVTVEPEETLKQLFARHGIDIKNFDYLACLPLGEEKTEQFSRARKCLAVNPARTYACGDEYSDYLAAIAAGIYPFVVAYGFEDRERLIRRFAVPQEVVSASPEEFAERLLHALDLSAQHEDRQAHDRSASGNASAVIKFDRPVFEQSHARRESCAPHPAKIIC